ncbi:peptidase S8/S53 domain-containing protein [Lasiosphaeria miniovina]|uniref:tripeptidyl-peptidase II n=1 Tax=Lasiosphaeria miniovina TaxID=1954250 RepID=A0AA40DJG8_9PEZI|nr:peptidase S8/S53 domain-containing protein [Lasiosphaeria miniovina]KAK0705874.1 peptidase S8/S53 domain-containing protein [Lasiosphaeria miniovina]
MLLSLLFAAVASARVMDRLAAVPKDWRTLGQAALDEPVSLRIALKQQHTEALEQAVLEMSTPGHPNYGLHMTRDEVRSYTAPSGQATAVVSEWLRKHGVEPLVDNDWVSFTTTVGTANGLLGTKFGWYEYVGGGGPKLRTLSYAVPEDVAVHVDLVQPTTRFGQLGAKKSTIFEMRRLETVDKTPTATTNANFVAQAGAAVCGSTITPDCLKSLYNINYTASASADNKVAFASYLEEYARYADLQTFEERYAPAAKGQNFTVQLANGGLDDQKSSSDSGEANLDIQYILGISHPIPILEYSTGGRGPLVPTRDQPRPPGSNEPYLEWLTFVLGQPDSELPQTISTSYGEEEQSVPQDYAVKVCNLFMQLGARGVSVLFSSGDSGPGNSCVRNTNNKTFFEPTFPAGCPWVTSVGATTGTAPERAVGFSSGGFSIYHAQPSYQAGAVGAYLQGIGSTYAAYFNSSGRAIPDVAAQGSNFAVIDKGFNALLSGTSASSPVFAGVVALLNAARKSQGQPPLGFLNPWLYNNTAAFNDVTTGSGVGCYGSKDLKNGARWNATVGWDPVTGLGTPKFDKLLEAAAPGVPNA